jgi:hypothetical protein
MFTMVGVLGLGFFFKLFQYLGLQVLNPSALLNLFLFLKLMLTYCRVEKDARYLAYASTGVN